MGLLVAVASGKVHEELDGLNHQPLTAAKEAPFKACIDDSDCGTEGHGFACFQYICYPWADDTAIPAKDKKETCKSNDDCTGQLKQLPCVNHLGCKDLGYGNFCCPPKGNSTEAPSVCCNDDPNPTTTPRPTTTPQPRSRGLAGSSSGIEVTLFVVLLSPLLLLRK